MRGNKVVVGVFSHLDQTIAAVKAAKESDLDYKVYSPVPNHYLEHATSETRSPVRMFTLTGGVTGCVFGFALAILCSLDYPIRTSAKAIVSVPAFVVIGYECAILFGALATLFAIFYFAKVPNILRPIGYDARFSRDKFGVVVGCDSRDVDEVKDNLLQVGAEEVEVRDGL